MLRALLMAVCAFALVACGEPAPAGAPSTGGVEDRTLTPTPGPEELPDALATLEADGRFSTFTALIRQVGFDGFFVRPGWHHTVFAPTDDAFEALPSARFDALAADEERLKRMLDSHIYPEALSLEDLRALSELPTIGSLVRIRTSGDTVRYGVATVIEADIQASNGIVHVIDHVITDLCLEIGVGEPSCTDLLEDAAAAA